MMMKNISLKLLFFISVLTLVACKKEDDLMVQNDSFAAKVTQNVALPLTVTSKDQIQFDLLITTDSASRLKNAVLQLDENELHSASASADNKIAVQYTYTLDKEEVGKSLIFRLVVSDEEGRVVNKDFTVYVQLAPADIRITIPEDAPTEVLDNETADFNIAVTSENDIKYIKTFADGNEITSLTKETFTNPREDSYRFTYQPKAADADKTLAFLVEVMDVMGNIVKKDFTLTIKRSQASDFTAYFDVNLGAQRSTAHGPFFNAANGEVYATTGSASKSGDIDLVVFYSGSSRAYNITSPTLASVSEFIYTVAAYGDDAIVNWPAKNQTLIKKISISREEFDLAAASDIEAFYTEAAGAAEESSGGLADNNVMVFRTADNKYGLLYVKSRSANANTGHLTVDIKMQK